MYYQEEGNFAKGYYLGHFIKYSSLDCSIWVGEDCYESNKLTFFVWNIGSI